MQISCADMFGVVRHNGPAMMRHELIVAPHDLRHHQRCDSGSRILEVIVVHRSGEGLGKSTVQIHTPQTRMGHGHSAAHTVSPQSTTCPRSCRSCRRRYMMSCCDHGTSQYRAVCWPPFIASYVSRAMYVWMQSSRSTSKALPFIK